ncbi:MAG: hypothetical protein R2845_05925 [Thermomicrobiales bacterium]
MAAANAEPDPGKRRSLLVEANNIVNNDCPVQVICFTKRARVIARSSQLSEPDFEPLVHALSLDRWMSDADS